MTDLVYISDWQIQCCGEEFAVGDEVAWPIAPVGVTDWESLVGPELAAALTGSYEAHEDEPTSRLTGTVRGIRTVSCRYAPAAPPEDARTLCPVPGTTVLGGVEAIEKWYGTDFDPLVLRFCGWLVDLDVSP